MTIAKITQLKEAYEWEQDRVRAWIEEMRNNSGDQSNPMIVRFFGTWLEYFAEIQASNASVIATCDDAIAKNTGAAAFESIRRINRGTHRKAALSPIVDAAQVRR